ncbi:MAG: glutamate--tRNA ligase [Deltaproteobacteria bacterium]|nr:glutamate--tRNA ligase [Deltaproteobacteria bacterium]
MIRVRFAPSPTGHLHIGGARTALFNYLFVRRAKGTFILRIEDTDQERSTQEYTDSILKGMEWMGMEWDEGPFHQMERIDLYREHVEKLLKEGKAYRCYCTAAELDIKRKALLAAGKKPKYEGTCRELDHGQGTTDQRPYCIRFKAPQEGTVTFNDICRGEISVNKEELDDMIILRTDGTPTYNFTVVVDDVTMNITHVIRGDDHLNNTPRQIQLYEAFDYPTPQFAHLPMILGPDKQKLSKRHGAVSVIEYKAMGFLPEAMLNYLARLGWSHGDQEIFSKKELIEHFDLKVVGKSPSVFDIGKCTWVNSQHMQKLSPMELVGWTKPYLEALGVRVDDSEFAAKAICSERERGKTLKELAEISAFYFRDEVLWDDKAVQKWLNPDGKQKLQKLQMAFQQLTTWNAETLQKTFDTVMKELGLKKMVELAQPARTALTGTSVSPGLFEVMTILGKEKVLKRFEHALHKSA